MFALWFAVVIVGSLFWQYRDRPGLPDANAANSENQTRIAENPDVSTLKNPASDSTQIAATPQPPPVPAQLKFAVTPWGEVLVDGKSIGVTPPLTQTSLPAGQHEIEIRNGSAPAFSQTIRIASGENQTIRHKF